MPAFFTELRSDNDDGEGTATDFVEIAVPQGMGAESLATNYTVHDIRDRRDDATYNLENATPGTPFTHDGITYDVYVISGTDQGLSYSGGNNNGIALVYEQGNGGSGATLQLVSVGPTFTMRSSQNFPPYEGETGDPTSVSRVNTTGTNTGNAAVTPESAQLDFPTSIPADVRNLTYIDTFTDPARTPDPGFVDAPAAVCYCAGTTVTTPKGLVNVEDIKVGDLIVTQDNGPQPVRWVGHRALNADQLSANPKLRPVRIIEGALGDGFPKRDLCVSRQHRVLLRSQVATRMFGTDEVLIPAVHLCALPGIFVDESITSLTYVHILFDQHEIIFAEGSPAESLFLGPNALEALSPEAQEEIQTIFPEVSRNNTPDLVRIVPERKERKTLIDEHLSDQEARAPSENVLN